MPTINKQLAGAKPRTEKKKSGNTWDDIEPLHDIEQGISLVIYGKSGSGKTRAGASAPKPLLIAGGEDGTKSIRGDVGIDFKRLHKSQDIYDLIIGCQERRPSKCMPGKPYASFMLDTASMLQDLRLKEILGIDKLPEQLGWGIATQQQYGQCSAEVKEYLRAILNLTSLNMNVIITCQERNFTENTDTDVIMPSVGSALFPALTGWLHPAADNVGQMYIRRKRIEQETTIGGKKVKRMVEHPKDKEFCLRTEVHEVYATKWRVPRGRKLPECLIDPDWSKIVALINGD